MGIMKKVIATTDEKTFYKFKDRVREEGLTMGECLNAMISLYAEGGEIVSTKEVKEKIVKSVDTYREYKSKKSPTTSGG